MKKQVEGHATRQAPANRTIWIEQVFFHITGANGASDFTDISKALRCINAGREVTAYYLRDGYTLGKGLSFRTCCDESKNCGMTPTASTYHIATIKRGCKDYDKKLEAIQRALKNNNKQGETITF